MHRIARSILGKGRALFGLRDFFGEDFSSNFRKHLLFLAASRCFEAKIDEKIYA